MSICTRALAPFALAVAAWAQSDAPAKPEIKVHGDIEIQARRDFFKNGSKNNLDQFFGRVNFGASMKGEGVSGRINIRAFPEGFGYEVLTGASFDTTGQGSIRATRTGISNFQIENAWLQYDFDLLSMKVGRYFTSTSKTLYFGNYLNQNSGGVFLGKVSYHNALEFMNKTGPLTSSVLLAAGDKNLNTGSLRVHESVRLMESITFGAGYFSNVFDTYCDEDAVVHHRFAVNADYTISKGLMPYAEVGILQDRAGDTWGVPVVVGTTIPTGGALNNLAVEVEYSTEAKREDNPLAVNIHLDKTLSPNARIRAGLSNSNSDGDWNKTTFGVRFQGLM